MMIWQILSKLLVKFNGIFLPKAVSRQLFAWQTKFGEIDPYRFIVVVFEVFATYGPENIANLHII